MTTPDRPDLDALGKLCDAATPGPWSNGHDPSHFDTSEVSDNKTFAYYVPDENNARFIAAARTALPALIAYARRVEGERDALRGDVSASVNEAVAPLRAECERLRGLLPTVERKLGYLLRDYPDDKETTGLIESIRKESTHVR